MMKKQEMAQDGSTEPLDESTTNRTITANRSGADTLHLTDQIKKSITAPKPSAAARAELLADIHRLQLAVETPLETIYRIGHQSWQNACVRIAIDLGIFDALVKKEGDSPVSVQKLASACGADAVFLVRIMRVIVALGLCAESGVEEYKANSKTEIMTIPQGISSFKTWFDIFVPAATKLPEHMRSQHYQNPTQPTNSAFACATGSEFWNHLKKTPEHAEIFNNFMATRRQGKPNWHDIYPIEQELSSENIGQDDILLVDVGGNRGHDLVNIRAKHPRLVGKMVVQDLPSVVAHASFPSDSNITAMPHDFFSPQPIQ
ncbi:MAG: hypothetical protein L6R39_003737, partial [Caloplaca ligustica]